MFEAKFFFFNIYVGMFPKANQYRPKAAVSPGTAGGSTGHNGRQFKPKQPKTKKNKECYKMSYNG